MKIWNRTDRLLTISTIIFLLCIAIGWLAYILLGHRLMEAMYKGESIAFLNSVIQDRSTPLKAYLDEGDRIMRLGTLTVVIIFFFLLFLLKARLLAKVSLMLSAFFLFTFLPFCLFEFLPSLIRPLKLDAIDYYYVQDSFLPDTTLVYRNKPLTASRAISDFRGDQYSPLYGVAAPSLIYESTSTDEDGFAYSDRTRSPDVVVIGDSMIEMGLNKDDPFATRLERISGLTVTNLGVGGYGPFQYLEVLKRYGVPKKPKYALFVFFEGNDLVDIREYLAWKQGGDYNYSPLLSRSFFGRYAVLLQTTGRQFKNIVAGLAQLIWVRLFRNQEEPHPDIADLNLGKNQYKVLFFYKNNTKSPSEMLKSEEWQELEKILVEFASVSRENKIVPIILFIPTTAHIYAEYSTEHSGRNWLRIRDEQVAAKANRQTAMVWLASKLNIQLIDLSPAFDKAARDGRMLYYPFDTHWNSEARETAAAFVAATLRSK